MICYTCNVLENRKYSVLRTCVLTEIFFTRAYFSFFCSVELAMIMDRLYGGVCYAGIDTDPELKYPKGAGRVAFSNQQSYIAAISARFVQLQHGDIDKRVSIRPAVLRFIYFYLNLCVYN